MSLVLCDGHRMFVDALAMALRARDHDVAATCSDLQALPGVLRQARPDLCVLGRPVRRPGQARGRGDGARQCPGDLRARAHGLGHGERLAALRVRHVDALVSKSVDIRTRRPRGAAGARRRALRRGLRHDRFRPSHGRPENEPLTAREREVIALLVDGVSTALMAESLGVSTNTVRSHVQNVLRKLGVHHRSKAAHRAVELGLVRVAGLAG